MNTYPVGDFLIRVKNAALAGRHEFNCPSSRLIKEVAKVLEKEGYLDKVSKKDKSLMVRLAYKRKKPVILDIKLVSRPGLRIYMGTDEIDKRERRGVSILILSTPKGIMSSNQALKQRVGGEVIAEVS